MKILFTLVGSSRRSNYLTGDSLRYGGGGGSGTDTSTILVAEHLASKGHEVVIVSEELEPGLKEKYQKEGNTFRWGDKSRGVIYSNFQFENVDIKEFDILINSLWYQDYDKLPVKITKALIYWCHMQWMYGIGEMINYSKANNLKLGFVNISEWEKSMNQGTIDHAVNNYPDTKQTLIPNPIMDDIITEVLAEQPVKKPHKFIFHASWPRGGSVSFEAVDKLELPDKEFHAFDYLMVIHDHGKPYFHRHMGVDKKTLFKHLAESEYFVYPLYTPYQDVHKDTFSCVVAEAIALGAIPVTYPLGALPENFNDYCYWIDFPEGVDAVKMQNESLSKDLDGKFKNNLDNIVKAVNWLESNPQYKDKIRQEGKDYILSKFNTEKVGKMWTDFIDLLLT